MVEVILGGYLEAQAYYKASLSLYQWNFSQSSEWFQVSSSFFFLPSFSVLLKIEEAGAMGFHMQVF